MRVKLPPLLMEQIRRGRLFFNSFERYSFEKRVFPSENALCLIVRKKVFIVAPLSQV